MVTKTPVEQEASRLRILRAAAEVAAETGYDGASISKITQRSGLPASSVYWFFKDKDQLMAEVIRHSITEWYDTQPRWERNEWDTRPVGEVMRSILSRSVRSLSEGPAYLRIGHMLLLQSREVEPEARKYFVQVRADIEVVIAAWIASFMTAGTSPDSVLAMDLARIILAATDGVFLAAEAGLEFNADDTVELLVAIIETALSAC